MIEAGNERSEDHSAEQHCRVEAVIFDLDGVLVETTELHYESWKIIANQLAIPFERSQYEPMRGLGRAESLALLLGTNQDAFTDDQKQALLVRKNELYLELLERMTPADLLPGAAELLVELEAAQVPLAVASSSRNAEAVLKQLEIRAKFAVIVDANTAPRSKPDPQVFFAAAEALNVTPTACVVIEDAEAGVSAGLAAGMRVVGIGPPERVGQAHLVVPSLQALSGNRILTLSKE